MAKGRNIFSEDEDLEQEFNIEQLKKIGRYVLPYKSKLFVAFIVILVSSLANLVTPLLMKYVIDDFIPNRDLFWLFTSSALFVVIILLSTISMKFRIRYMAVIGQGMIHDIRSDIFKHIQKLPFTYYDSRPHGKILVRVVNYVNSLSDLLSNGLINLVVDIFSFVVATIIMIRLNPLLTLIVFLFVPIASYLIFLVKEKQRKSMQELSQKQSNMTAYIHESISGMKVTQSFTREEVNLKVFETLMDEYQEKWMKSRHYIGLIFPIVKNVSVISQGVMLIFALLVLKSSISVGVIVAFLGYTGSFWMPLLNISEFYNQLVTSSAYLERIFETMDVDPAIKDVKDAISLPPVEGVVEFKNVTFGYEENQAILKEFNLQVNKGEKIALVGPTGAGKTTVVNLISRFYDVNEGEVLIDGHNISKVSLNSLRSQMGIMMQDTFVFSGTIMENIRYGKLDATDDEVVRASKAVNAHSFIELMNDGYDTQVNERGTRLSTGQRQLISFARALLKDPRILILDEATSSIDTQTEKIIQDGLDILLEGRTSFVIAHRLATIKKADRIIVINNQGIEEMGTHEELIEKKGHYHNLYMAQIRFLNEATA